MRSILTVREAHVIAQLTRGQRYGLELVAGSRGLLRRNAVYVLLKRMENKGLVVGREMATPKGESGPPRRVYSVTELGARALAAHDFLTF